MASYLYLNCHLLQFKIAPKSTHDSIALRGTQFPNGDDDDDAKLLQLNKLSSKNFIFLIES